ncbi:MAG: aldo/keto reductase [Spirochaetota bacterium]
MEYRQLGHSDLRVSTIGFGCWGISGGSMWGDQDESDSIHALHAAVDSGITFFDTAEGYGGGYSEEVVGRAFQDRRDKVLIATKVSPSHLAPDDLRASCEASLERLQTDHVDLYQIHWPDPPGDADAVAETLEQLRREGKIRFVGVSNFGPIDLNRYPSDLFVSNQLAYSVAFRAIEFHLVDASVERGMSIITYSTLLHGVLTGKYASADEVPPGRARTRHFSAERDIVRHGGEGHEETLFSLVDEMRVIAEEADLSVREVAMLWVLAQKGVATILAGSRDAAQARTNAEVGDLHLAPELIARLTRASESLKEAMGPNPDMWQHESRVKW